MPITVKCASCKSKYQVRDSLAGQFVVCKTCGEQAKVPESSSASSGDLPVEGYGVKEPGAKTSRSAKPRKSSSETSERVLPRAASSLPRRAGSSGNQQMLWIVGGAAALLLIVVVVIVSSVGSSPEPVDQIGKLSPSHSGGTPPPEERSADSSRPAARNVSTDRSAAGGRAKPDATKPPVPVVETQTSVASEASSASRGESISEKAEVAIVTDVIVWDVKVDPPDEPFEPDSKKKILATFPKKSISDVVYPDCPSPFVALGSNKKAGEIREVRDVQANRRLGSIRGPVIVNAQTALSPDGLFFAAWAAGQNRIAVWDVKAERPHGVVTTKESTSPSLVMFAGVERLIAVGDKNELLIWSMPGGQPQRAIPLPVIAGSPVAGLSPGGQFLAIAGRYEKKRFLRVINLATGVVAAEIRLESPGEKLPECRAVAFSPDGVELAMLYECANEMELAIIRVAGGKLAERFKIDERLQAAGPGTNDRPGRALEWFPGRKRLLVYGRGVVDRAKGKIVWWMPDDEDSAVSVRRVLDDRRLLTLGVEKNDPAIVAYELGDGEP